jgi:hypothetical protein
MMIEIHIDQICLYRFTTVNSKILLAINAGLDQLDQLAGKLFFFLTF